MGGNGTLAIPPVLRSAVLRGLALIRQRGDPIEVARADALIATLDPEATALVAIYTAYDVATVASQWCVPAAAPAAMAMVHEAIDACRPLIFGYTDRFGRRSDRSVWPLAIVYPPQGVKLLAWCVSANGYRQFFVRAMVDLEMIGEGFTAHRQMLLDRLVIHHARDRAGYGEDDDD